MYNANFNYEPLPPLQFDNKRSRVKECPCGKSNKDGKFVPYKGHDDKGYCHSCGETFLPPLPNSEKFRIPYQVQKANQKIQVRQAPDVIPLSTFKEILKQGANLCSQNNFIKWLSNSSRGEYAFDSTTIKSIIEKYYLCNSTLHKYKGWVLFPYIDIEGKLRDIKAMDYDSETGKRIKAPYNKVVFMGKEILNNPLANTDRCFYGEHLLKDNNKPVKIFESEASATYASAFFPESICLATGGANGCKWTEKSKCKVLQGRFVTLYPDIDAHDSWEEKAKNLKSLGINVVVSQLIKKQALAFAVCTSTPYPDLIAQKFDLRDILKFKNLETIVAPAAPVVIDERFTKVEEIVTGARYDNMIIANAKTESGKELKLLFHKNGDAVIEQTALVNELAVQYRLKLLPLIIDGATYLGESNITRSPTEKI